MMIENLARTIKIGERIIGSGHPCYIVAEIGINHNGDVELAKQMMEAAKEAGADAAKFQNYRAELFVADRTLTYKYISQGIEVVESQYDMFKRYELTSEMLKELKAFADEIGLGFHSTPMDDEGVRELVALGIPLLKNGSDCLTHLPLLRTMGRTGLPVVISTGMGTLAEIDEAVRAVRSVGNDEIVLLHCVSAYPTSPSDVHLRKIPTLAAAFGCPVGFSDHTDGTSAAIGAVALGACWVEKHFTTDKNLPGPDQRFSADQRELTSLVRGVRAVSASLGEYAVRPTSTEQEVRGEYRLSCVVSRDLDPGHILVWDDISYSRPANGLPPGIADQLVGRKLARAKAQGRLFTLDDFEV